MPLNIVNQLEKTSNYKEKENKFRYGIYVSHPQV